MLRSHLFPINYRKLDTRQANIKRSTRTTGGRGSPVGVGVLPLAQQLLSLAQENLDYCR
jgi:hypothetical protein